MSAVSCCTFPVVVTIDRHPLRSDLDALAMDETLEVVALVEDVTGREASPDQLAKASPHRPIQEQVGFPVRPCAGQTFGYTARMAGEPSGRERDDFANHEASLVQS
jgi:hypothetical protein